MVHKSCPQYICVWVELADKAKVLSGSSGLRAFLGSLQGKQPLDYPGPALTTA